MAELNLKQITDKLNSEFASDVRKLVFWYDANAEFQEDIDSIELENAKVLHLEPDNQFYISNTSWNERIRQPIILCTLLLQNQA